MPELVGFLIIVSVLAMLITGSLGMYIAGEKGRSTVTGFACGALLSIFGIIWVSFMKPSDKQVIQDMYDRELMDLQEYEKTMEFIFKN